MSKKNTEKTRLVEMIKKMLGERASKEVLKEVAPEIIGELGPDMPSPMLAELVVRKVIRLAMDPKRANQWAVELIFDRIEGKAAQGKPPKESGRELEDRLDDITRANLNSLAAPFAKTATTELIGGDEITNKPSGPASRLLDLPKNKSDSTENQNRESSLEEESEGEST